MLEASFNTQGTAGPVAVFFSYWNLFILWYDILFLYTLQFYDHSIRLSPRKKVEVLLCNDLKVSSNLKLVKNAWMREPLLQQWHHSLRQISSTFFTQICQWCQLLSAYSQFPGPVLLPSWCNWTNATNQQPSERTVAAWGFAGSRLCEQLGIRSNFYSCW